VPETFEHGFPRWWSYQQKVDGYDPAQWYLAYEGGELAGVCLCIKSSYEDKECGYVAELGVRRSWRGRGMGLALLHHAFQQYYRQGFRKVALHLDASNLTGALGLYQRAGMHIHRQYDQYEKVLRDGEELSTVTIQQ